MKLQNSRFARLLGRFFLKLSSVNSPVVGHFEFQNLQLIGFGQFSSDMFRDPVLRTRIVEESFQEFLARNRTLIRNLNQCGFAGAAGPLLGSLDDGHIRLG